jgi:hypothetical protein
MGGARPASPGGSADDVDDGEVDLRSGDDGDRTPVRHRRATRDLVIGGGAIAVLLVLVGVGVLSIVRQSDDQTSAGGDDDTMPLLGWRNGTYSVSGFRAGFEYAGTWWPPGSESGDHSVVLSINPEGLYPVPEGEIEAITVGGQEGRLVHLSERRLTTAPEYIVDWEPRPGWTAMLWVASPRPAGPLDGDGQLDLLTRAARTVRPVAPEAFGVAVDRGTQGMAAPEALVFATDEGRSAALWVNSAFVIIALEPTSGGSGITELCISDGSAERRLDGPAVTVRGTEGMVVDVAAPRSPPTTGPPPDIGPNGLKTIVWSEGEASYRLAVDGSVSTEDAVAIADAMSTPDAEEWGELFVVTEPPRFGSDIYC